MSRTFGGHFGWFLVIGAAGTASHYLVLVLLVEYLGLGAVSSSQAGAVVGALINYVLNRRLNYRITSTHLQTGPRFFAVVVAGFLVNGLCVAMAAEAWGWHYLPAQVMATVIVLVWNFLANHWWTFRYSP